MTARPWQDPAWRPWHGPTTTRSKASREAFRNGGMKEDDWMAIFRRAADRCAREKDAADAQDRQQGRLFA
jgi:hypothetical protein